MEFNFNFVDYLRKTYGQPLNIVRLGGLSQAQVWRVDFATGSKVVKYRVGMREINFYQRIAPILQQHGLALPLVEQIWAKEPETWLIMEYLPISLPRSRWLADAQQILYLKKLHSFGMSDFPELTDYFQPAWPDVMTEQALSVLPSVLAIEIKPKLDYIRQQSQFLFEQHTVISGDPNPLNWAVRDSEQLVLFDWERFGFGAPAIDLAITAPGLGNASLFEKIAGSYLNSDDEQMTMKLMQQIVLAKAWLAVEFLSLQACGILDQPASIDFIGQQLPNLLQLVR